MNDELQMQWILTPHPARRERVGLLCRWAVLAMAGGLLALTAVTAVIATGRMVGDKGAGLVASDWAGVAGRSAPSMWSYASLSVPSRSPRMPAVGALSPNGSTVLAYTTIEGAMIARLGQRLAAGPQPAAVFGLPHGPLAARRLPVTLLGIPPEIKAVLMDARLVQQAAAGRADELWSFMDVLRRRGQLVLFHPGPMDDYVAARSRLLRREPRLTLAYSRRSRSDGPAVVRELQRGIGQTVAVITADSAVAEACRPSSSFELYFVGSELPPTRPRAAELVPSAERLGDILPRLLAP